MPNFILCLPHLPLYFYSFWHDCVPLMLDWHLSLQYVSASYDVAAISSQLCQNIVYNQAISLLLPELTSALWPLPVKTKYHLCSV